MSQPAAPDHFAVVLPESPYPGLRRFEKTEWPIFFGRESMIDTVIDRLIRQHVVVVHGDSGCGKSSLLRAGVLARLEQENARSGLNWRTCETQPLDDPLRLLAEKLAALNGQADDDGATTAIRRALNFGDQAPAHLERLLWRGTGDHLCILIDQFEELFAFARRHGPQEAQLLVKLIIELLRQPRPGLFAVITMRSEFLGVCSQFAGLAEAVNDAQYLLPRMDSADLLRAIREPATLYGGHVSPDLAERLIADAGGGQDQLPLIQHGLAVMCGEAQPAEAGAGSSALWHLRLTDYVARGNLSQLLSKHADDVALAAGNDLVVEGLFRALTDINAEGQAIRRPRTVGQLIKVIDGPPQDVCHVINVFRDRESSFLSPYTGDLTDTTLVDISHEALIRCWNRIADTKTGWLTREFQDGLIWKSLLVQADSFERDSSNNLSYATALEREAWLSQHNPQWATRYGGEWDRVARLIRASVAAGKAAVEAEQERANREAQAERDRAVREAQIERDRTLKESHRQKKQRQLISMVAALLAAGLVFSMYQYSRAEGLLAEARSASAASLWNRLDFREDGLEPDELNALWEITAADSSLQQAFFNQLMADPILMERFGRRPEPVIRALGWSQPWERTLANQALPDIVQAATRGDDTTILQRTMVLTAIAPILSREEADSIALPIARAIPNTTDPSTLGAVGRVLKATGPKLSDAVVQTLAATIIDQYPKTADFDQADALLSTLEGIGPRLSADLAWKAMQSILAARVMQSNAAASDDWHPRTASAVRAIGDKLTGERATEGLNAVVRALALAGDPDQRNNLVRLVEILARGLTPDQVRAAFTLEALAVRTITQAELENARLTPEQLSAIRPSLIATPRTNRRLTSGVAPAQILSVVTTPVRVVRKNPDAPLLSRDVTAALEAADKLNQTDAQRALSEIAAAIASSSNSSAIGNLVNIALRAAPGLNPPAAAAVLLPFVNAIDSPRDRRLSFVALRSYSRLLEEIARRVGTDQAPATLGALLRRLGSPSLGVDIVAPARILADKVSEAQAQEVSRAVWSTARDVQVVAALTKILQGRLTPAQAETAAAIFAAELQKTDSDSDYSALLAIMPPLFKLLTPEERLRAFAAMLDAIPKALSDFGDVASLTDIVLAASQSIAPSQSAAIFDLLAGAVAKPDSAESLAVFASALEALAHVLTADKIEAAMTEARTILAWSRTPQESVAAASALAALLIRVGGARAIEAAVETIKYPAAAGESTTVLLRALKDIVDAAPGPDAGVSDNVKWAAQYARSIDPDARAVCPPPKPGWTGFTCPAGK